MLLWVLFISCVSVLAVLAQAKPRLATSDGLGEFTLPGTSSDLLVESITFHLKDDHWKALKVGSKVHSALDSSNFLSWNGWNAGSGESREQMLEFRFWLEIYLTKLLTHLGRFHYSLQLLHGLEDDLLKAMNQSARHEENLPNAWEFNCTYLSRVLYYQGYTSLYLDNRKEAFSRLLASMEACPCSTQAYLPFFQARSGRMVKDVMDENEVEKVRNYLEDLLNNTIYEEEEILYRRNGSTICKFEKDLIGRENLYEIKRLASFVKGNVPILSSLNSQHWSLHQQYRLILSSFQWSLFYYYDLANDTSSAWSHLLEAQRLEKFRLTESKLYNVRNSVQDVELARQYYPSSYWPERKEDWIGLKDENRPIFIVGFFRTGSTLLENLLASSHPSIWGMGEKKLLVTVLNEFQEELQRKNTAEIATDRRKFFKLLSKLLKKTGLKYVGTLTEQANDLSTARSILNESYFLSSSSLNVSNLSSSSFLLPLRRSLENDLIEGGGEEEGVGRRGGNIRLIDKMLGNYKNIPLIHLIFPNALILHLVRDPLDTLFSCLKNQFSDASAYNLDFQTLIEEYISYLEIIAHYRKVLPVLDYPGGRRKALVDIRYEELVANPKKVLQQLSSLLQLPLIVDNSTEIWNEGKNALILPSSSLSRGVTQGRRSSNSVSKTISFLQVQQPINSQSVGGWRKYGKEFSESIIPLLKPHLNRLGRKDALPYLKGKKKNEEGKEMNWALQEQFDYSQMLQSFSGESFVSNQLIA